MQKYSKFIAAVLAAAGVIASSGLLSGPAEQWTITLIAAVGAALVYFVRNDTTEADHDGDGSLRA